MDTVRVEGVTYTKVATIAKKFRYTTDYVGQLCRSGKVDCQFVGRAWYVSEESLLKHKDGRYIESRVSEKTSNNNTISGESEQRISVNPRMKKVTAKQVLEPTSHFLTRLEVGGSTYYPDETELLPQPLKPVSRERILPTVPATIAVAPSDAVAVRVTATTKPKKLAFTEVPEVALRGQLTVHDVDVDTVSTVVTASDIAQLEPPASPKVVVDEVVDRPAPKTTKSPLQHHESVMVARTPSFTPVTIPEPLGPSRLGLLLSVALVASTVFAGFFVSAFQVFVIDGTEVSASIMFSFEALLKLL